MGLCKCPRKKVTNLFCFEHRVNVCEHCMLETHERCVVQSYLEWLQDSDFDTDCTLCSAPLAEGTDGVVRLLCLHLYHWRCLEARCAALPPTTAPAGYKCPLCGQHAIPRLNDASPVADRLRATLATAHWARAGLGLPVLPELAGRAPADERNGSATTGGGADSAVGYSQVHGTTAAVATESSISTRKLEHSRHQIDFSLGGAALAAGSAGGPNDADVGEAKYQRRSAMEWLARWLRSRNLIGNRRAGCGCRRYALALLVAVLFAVAALLVLGRGGDWSQQAYDPFLDPLANPNIRIDRQDDVYGHMA